MRYVDPTGEFVIPLAIPVLPAIGTVIAKGVALAGAVIVGLVLGDAASEIINGESQEESENQKAGSVKQQLESNAQATSPNPIPPSPDNDDKNGDYYENSSKHHQNAKGNISQEPQNAAEMFDKSVKDPNKPNTRWYRDKEGTFHRFQGSNHKYHWNGSTKTGTRMESIPIEIRRNRPKGDL